MIIVVTNARFSAHDGKESVLLSNERKLKRQSAWLSVYFHHLFGICLLFCLQWRLRLSNAIVLKWLLYSSHHWICNSVRRWWWWCGEAAAVLLFLLPHQIQKKVNISKDTSSNFEFALFKSKQKKKVFVCVAIWIARVKSTITLVIN